MPGTRRSGRKRKPTELKVLEGTFRSDRHGDAPQVKGQFPRVPSHLSPAESALWESMPKVPWIVESDWLAVNGAVSTFERILRNQKAQAATEQAGNPLAFKYSHDADGNQNVEPKENPLITQEMRLWNSLRSWLATLGLTPADRAKMSAPKIDDEAANKWAGIL